MHFKKAHVREDRSFPKALLFFVGAVGLLGISMFFILFVLGPGGSGGLLFTAESKCMNETKIGVVLPTLDSAYYDRLVLGLYDEAEYYDWEVETRISSIAGSELEALEELINEGIKAAIIDPIGLNEATIRVLDERCKNAGIPCIMLLNEGERFDCCSSSVWYDTNYLGSDMAYKCDPGEAFLIGSQAGNASTLQLKRSLLRDSHYGIALRSDVQVQGISYLGGRQSVRTTAEEMLRKHPNMHTCFILDPAWAWDTMQALNQTEFSGTVFCYAYETDLKELRASTWNFHVIYEYFSIGDTAYYCLMAIADQMLYDTDPQYYAVYPCSW
ncbi:MAG: hypothetical protein VB091_04050 [Christensenella sp.]|nr:hypothetical protein [Christensenella sp.]